MKRPSTRTMVLGHPLVMVPAELFGAFVLYGCWQGGSAWLILAVLTGSGMAAVMDASEKADAYKRWKREWDALEDPAERPPSRRATYAWMIFGAVVMFAILASTGEGTDSATLAIDWLIAMGGSIAVYALLLGVAGRRRYRPVRAVPAKPVAVIAKTVLPVPTLAAAYRALPEHCQRLLARSGS